MGLLEAVDVLLDRLHLGGALQPRQKVIVVSAFGSSVAPVPDWPVQAADSRAREVTAARVNAAFGLFRA
ncbi:hypothetical protein GCM10009601_05340 [Streptomyces thermospinosisporus]|uniref:Uncharacterized protein n=1 Tax=Streptomyces thermospinosisporus TaxID=161482 RepID=A0ABN2TW97_9ACTN